MHLEHSELWRVTGHDIAADGRLVVSVTFDGALDYGVVFCDEGHVHSYRITETMPVAMLELDAMLVALDYAYRKHLRPRPIRPAFVPRQAS